MDIKPIETVYKGYKFRSRLEARWAVFFDAMGIEWEYEPEGFELSDGTRYLPDFYLKNVEYGIYAEVKPDDGDFTKSYRFCFDSGESIWLLEGIPSLKTNILLKNTINYWDNPKDLPNRKCFNPKHISDYNKIWFIDIRDGKKNNTVIFPYLYSDSPDDMFEFVEISKPPYQNNKYHIYNNWGYKSEDFIRFKEDDQIHPNKFGLAVITARHARFDPIINPSYI
jgi:hypothetical protein